MSSLFWIPPRDRQNAQATKDVHDVLPWPLNLRVLKLDYCGNLSDSAVGHLHTCTNLEELYLGQCTRLSDKACRTLSILKLRVLDLAGCFRISFCGLRTLFSRELSDFLEDFRAPPCLGELTAMDVREDKMWPMEMKIVRHLSLSCSPQIVEDFFTDVLPRKFPNLVSLEISHSSFNIRPSLVAQSIGTARENLKGLKQLRLISCKGVSISTIAYLRGNFPLVHIQENSVHQSSLSVRSQILQRKTRSEANTEKDAGGEHPDRQGSSSV
jgi:hypothetical protein